MDDLNLRQQVAERLGWIDIERVWKHTLGGRLAKGKKLRQVPPYDSDIAAAWRLAKSINPRRIEIVYRDTGVTAILDGWTGDADTPPAAICKAWLAYMDSKQEQHDDQE